MCLLISASRSASPAPVRLPAIYNRGRPQPLVSKKRLLQEDEGIHEMPELKDPT